MDPAKLHLELSLFAQRRLRPALPDAPRSDDARLRALETDFLESERAAVSPRITTWSRLFSPWIAVIPGTLETRSRTCL